MDIDPILLKRLNPLVAGVIIAALIPFMRKLSDINIWLYKKCGWKGQAEFSDEKRNRWVSFNQWFCGILAVVLILAAILFPDEWAQYFRIP